MNEFIWVIDKAVLIGIIDKLAVLGIVLGAMLGVTTVLVAHSLRRPK